MKLTQSHYVLLCIAVAFNVSVLERMTAADEPKKEDAITVTEARGRAKLLHEAFHATLHIVHLRYYREDEGLIIPARTLTTVFGELEKHHQVTLGWLAVNATPMNVDHKPKNKFEREAVQELTRGEQEYEAVEDGVYRRVGAITLTSECLKCHVPRRTSLEDRVAGLAISMPVKE